MCTSRSVSCSTHIGGLLEIAPWRQLISASLRGLGNTHGGIALGKSIRELLAYLALQRLHPLRVAGLPMFHRGGDFYRLRELRIRQFAIERCQHTWRVQIPL